MSRLKSMAATAQEVISAELYRAGHTPKSLEETQRDVLWWVYARVQAGLNLRPSLTQGWGIAWTSAGYAELVPIEVPRAGRDRVTVKVAASAVSPGTERAQYLRLPNSQVGVLGRPGYSAAGTVISTGGQVSGLRVGDPVAVSGAAHASVITVPGRQVFKVPGGVPIEEAALIMLGMICVNGADLASVQPGERVAVVGAGPIGILAFRIASAAGVPVAVVATSRRAEASAAASAAPMLTTTDDADEVSRLGADVVIEATGDPQGIETAIQAAGRGGRIVLLGSPRGITRDFAVEQVRAKGLRIVGAHLGVLDMRSQAEGQDARRDAGARFIDLVASGAVSVADLVGPAIDPRQAPTFYRELAEGRHSGGAYFDWRLMDPRDAMHRGHLLKPPNVTGRGMEAKHPLRLRKRSADLLRPPDPFEGAEGRLRLGLLGCGDIAVHNAAGAATAPNVEIVACFDPVTRLAEDLARVHGARTARTQEEVLDSHDVDAVVVSVPHDLHAPIAIEACRAGKNVIVEKPLARDLDGALAMAAAAREHGVWLSTSFPQRYETKVQVAHRLIQEGALGRVEGTLTQLFLDKSPAYWLGGFSGRARSDWRRSKDRAGGGILIMNLSHHLDLMRFLSGLELDTVEAMTQPASGIEDTVSATMRYRGGAVGSLLGSSTVRGSTEQTMSLWGEEGRIVLDPDPRVYTLKPIGGIRTTRWHSFGRLPAVPIRAVYLSRLATSVSLGAGPEVTAEDGVAVQAAIDAIYRSAERQGSADAGPVASGRSRLRAGVA